MKLLQARMLILILALLTLNSCKKQKTGEVLPADVTGKWKWVASYIDLPLGPNNPLTPANSSYSASLEFSSSNNWKRIINNSPVDSGKYSLLHSTYVNPSNTEFTFDKISYTLNSALLGYDWYEIHNDTLHICPCFGGSFTSFNVTDYFGGSKLFVRE